METNTKNPIFIVGCPRSGTTLLQQMLDAHPDIAIAPETHFIRNFYLKRETYGDLTQDVNYCRLIEDIVALPVFPEMGLNAEYFREAAWKIERSYAAIFNLILQQFACTKNARIVGEKTPNHLLYMSILEQFFPTARFIHIIRDPRAVINSWRKVPWSNGSLHEDAEVWRRYMATARLSPPSQGSILTIHYEQLVLNPEMSLRSVCDFLGLPFEQAMLSYHLLLSQTINTVREPWKNQATQSISQKSLDLWKKELSPSMVAEIEAVVWSEMKLLGYQTQTPLLQILIKSIPNQTKRNFRQIKNRLFQSIQTHLKTIATD